MSYHNCYETLEKELLVANIRINDDERILIYECAVRKFRKELNDIIKFNGENVSTLDDDTLKSLKSLRMYGFSVLEHNICNIYDNDGVFLKEEYVYFIYLNKLYLDYPFLDKLIQCEYPNYYNVPDDDYIEEDVIFSEMKISKLHIDKINSGRTSLKSKSLLNSLQDYSRDPKVFLKYFPNVLETKTVDNKKDAILKIIDMFYTFDKYTFDNTPLNDIHLEENKDKGVRTLTDWKNKIKNAINNLP